MATNTDGADQVTASTNRKNRRVVEWNRDYQDRVEKTRVPGCAEANYSRGRTSSPTSSGQSGAGSCQDDTSGTAASRRHNSMSHIKGHPASIEGTCSDELTSSQANGSWGNGSRGDASGSGSDTPREKSFTYLRGMPPIAAGAQAFCKVERNDTGFALGNSHHFDVDGFNLAQRMIHSNSVVGSGRFQGFLEGFHEQVKPNYPMHGCPTQGLCGGPPNRCRPGPEALCHQSLAQHRFEETQTASNVNVVRSNQHSVAFQGSARPTLGRPVVRNAGVARLLESVPPCDWANTTTVMLREIPVEYNRQMLLKQLERVGFLDGIDLLYLPIVKKLGTNRGYAFINFISPAYAWAFKYAYDGRSWSATMSARVARVIRSHKQGFAANYALYCHEWMKDPEARPWINPKLTASAPFVGFSRNEPDQLFSHYKNSLLSTPMERPSDEPDSINQTAFACSGHFPTEEWYL